MRENKIIFENSIKNRKLILFGAGNFARVFLDDFGDCYDIDCCISNNPKEKELITADVKTYRVFRVNERLKNYNEELIVLCADRHDEMEEQLFYMGFRYGVHYIDSGLFRCMVSRKKLALVYGVCYMRSIHDCLINSKLFSEEYNTYYKLSYQNMRPYEYEFFSFMLSCCDLFLYNAVLTQSERVKNDLFIRKLPEKCKKISIPILSFAGYHPQAIGPGCADNRYCVISKKTDWTPFLSPDHNINSAIESGKIESEIIDDIKRPDFYDRDFLETNYRREFRRMEIAEMGADITISDYIKENAGKKRLFYNEKHISNDVIIVLTKRILRLLGMDDTLDYDKLSGMELLHTSEVPIYPSVIEGLGLDIYMEKNPTYRMFTFDGLKDVTFEEYVRYYYDFCKDMKKHMEYGFFPGEYK